MNKQWEHTRNFKEVLQFFPTPEGYVKATPVGNANPDSPPTAYAYNYVFNYTDHLGNIRVSYTKDPQQGTLQILEENHYYPFGLRHEIYVSGSKRQHGFGNDGGGGDIDDVELINVLRTDYQYKYNGKEFQDELGLSWYDYGARNYDPTLGRWMNMDPLAEQYRRWSPYNYAVNNPVFFIDPDGMAIDTTIVKDNTDGTYTVKGWIDDGKTDVVTEDGTKVGESLTTHSFVDEHNNAVIGAVIDTSSTEGQDFIDKEIIEDNPNVFDYKDNAKLNEHYDFKSRGLADDATDKEALVHRTRGSMTADGKMASARDFGNMAAGIVAGRTGAPKWMIKREFEKLQGGPEPPVSAKAQAIGIQMGRGLFWVDLGKRVFENPIKPQL
jgi:RHS repeat-associated protein